MSNKVKLNIEEVKKIAQSRGGFFLSDTYVGVNYKYSWQCYYNHVWEAQGQSVLDGTWCKQCRTGISENICRAYFEAIFNEKFPKVRPSWLIGKKGLPLELDGYCEKLGIAFEHNGDQHYQNVRYFSTDLSDIRIRDQIKKEKCTEKNIVLIEIPQLFSKVKLSDLIEFIGQQLLANGKLVPNSHVKVDISSAYIVDYMSSLYEIALSKNGKLLDTCYLGATTPLNCFCNLHQITWKISPNNLKRGKWCPKCANVSRHQSQKEKIEQSRKEVEEIIGKKGGILKSEYVGVNKQVEIMCTKHNKTWKATPSNIKNGTWCPLCNFNKRSENIKKQWDKGNIGRKKDKK